MNKERFERMFHIKVEDIMFTPHKAHPDLYEVAGFGRYSVYHYIPDDSFEVTFDNSVVRFGKDLSKLI